MSSITMAASSAFASGDVATVTTGSTGNAIVRTRILAYLGQLLPDEYVSARKLCYDLDLRFSTAKHVLTSLEDRGWVDKVICNHKGVVAKFRIHPAAITVAKNKDGVDIMVPMVPPEWEAAYGRHPHAA